MRGLLVVGTSTAAREGQVAAALCSSLRSAGEEPVAFAAALTGPSAREDAALLDEAPNVFEAAASPAIAARHAGASLDPVALAEQARAAADGGVLVAAVSGGLLAQLTPRYSVRDYARELGVPVVITAAPSPDLLSQVRLTAEAARGAGLPVAAVVLSPWPEDPGRVLLDERRSLEALGEFTVLAPPAERWPVTDWLESIPVTAAPQSSPARITLDPYTAWEAHPVGDPRAAPRPRIMEVMLEIVGAEGPITANRAYSLYNKASGGKKLTSIARAPLSSSAYWLAQERKLTLVKKDDIPWQGDDVLRMPDQPAVRVRELGPRDLDEVPLDEIAELVRRIRGATGSSEPGELKRAVLNAYGLRRLTSKADEYLGLAIDLAE